MKFVFYTDTQLSGQTPRHRIDDYQKALIDKLKEIYKTAADEEADFLVCGGDFFNSHRIFSYEFLCDVMDIICDQGLDTYIVIGQHDMIGYNKSSYSSSTLAFVVRRCKNREHGLKVIWEPTTIGDVQLVASHVWEDLKDASKQDLDDKAFKVLVAHHLITNKKTMFDTVNTGDFCKWMADDGVKYDMVLSGDLHDGYDVHEVDGTWFCNPGSIARQAISDIHRPPRFAVIDAKPDEIPIIDVRDVQCAKPGDEVFGESAIELVNKTPDFDPTAFIKEVEDFEVESADGFELVQKVGYSMGKSKELMAYIGEKAAKLKNEKEKS